VSHTDQAAAGREPRLSRGCAPLGLAAASAETRGAQQQFDQLTRSLEAGLTPLTKHDDHGSFEYAAHGRVRR